MEDEPRITRLEERYTHLQEHVMEQDKVILEIGESLERLRRELVILRDAAETETKSFGLPDDERPPHY